MEEKKQPNKIVNNPKTIHTYMSDMADVVRENEMSVIKVALAEQRSRERGDYYQRNQESPKRKILFILGGIFILLIGVVGSYFLIEKAKEKNAPIEIIKTIDPLISYDNQVEINATNIASKIDLNNSLRTEIKTSGTPNSIKAIFLNKQTEESTISLSLSELLSIMRTTAPGSLLRSFSEKYLVGIYTSRVPSNNSNLFLIIEIDDYDQAYAGMLEWEKTMLGDLFNLFQVNIGEGESNLFEKSFKDIMIKNKDVRVLYSDGGREVLFYLFANKKTLVITDNREATEEVLDRILVGQTKPL